MKNFIKMKSEKPAGDENGVRNSGHTILTQSSYL